jgi:hypothetical protein
MPSKPSELVESIKQQAHARFDKTYVPTEPAPGPSYGLLPLQVVTSDPVKGEIVEVCMNAGGAPQRSEQALAPFMLAWKPRPLHALPQNLLWRLGDPAWTPSGIAGRMAQDLGLQPTTEKSGPLKPCTAAGLMV